MLCHVDQQRDVAVRQGRNHETRFEPLQPSDAVGPRIETVPDEVQVLALGVDHEQVLMVAAHPSDLRGAQRAGLRTAYVPRPLEHGANPHGTAPADALADDRFDVVADDFVDLARRLGA